MTRLLVLILACAPAWAADPPRVPPLPDDAAWKLLPREQPPLPAWARALAESMPKTTGKMLELDAAHRVRSPLGPVLRAQLRWAAADANRCEYAKRYAEADLKRAGGDPKSIDPADPTVAFARKLTLAGHSVTDDEVAALLKLHGPAKLVAVVHTVAYANFQDRVLLSLGVGVGVEPNGPLPPLDVTFDAAAKVPVPDRPAWKEAQAAKATAAAAGPDWTDAPFADIQAKLDKQQNRAGRIPLPDPAAIAKLPDSARPQATRVVWTNVSMGYQPALTKAWFDAMNTFHTEAKFDRVFLNTYFWVVTRSNDCFY